MAAVGLLAQLTSAPISALWPSLDPETTVRLLDVGASQVLAKPITADALLAALAQTYVSNAADFSASFVTA